MKVFKFGGASVKDADAVRNVGNILEKYSGEKLLVVISAMGKITNKLEELVTVFWKNEVEKKQIIIQELKDFHFTIASNLIEDKKHHIYSDLEDLLMELECVVEKKYHNTSYDEIYDGVICYGELLSTKIVSDYLHSIEVKNKWVDARNFIQTDSNFREGRVKWTETEETIKRILKPYVDRSIVITQGFIGRDEHNNTTTLGREGSDYSAAIFAYCLDAQDVTIWKDVAGVMNADPKQFANAVKLDAINYNQAIELAYYGASVIHPKTIQPLKSKNINLYVSSFLNMNDEGTVVKIDAPALSNECYIVKNEQTLLSIFTKNYSFIAEDNLSAIFDAFAMFKVRINVMQNSAISFSACCDTKEDKINEMVIALSNEYTIETKPNCTLLTIYNAKKENVLPEFLSAKKILLNQELGMAKQLVLA
ncbi:MAG: aspartate kinase [Bacteroidetes bacterium]|nr:aspartate kinase [Bacteroidota bacterium]